MVSVLRVHLGCQRTTHLVALAATASEDLPNVFKLISLGLRYDILFFFAQREREFSWLKVGIDKSRSLEVISLGLERDRGKLEGFKYWV